jgi:hypothetical protein
MNFFERFGSAAMAGFSAGIQTWRGGQSVTDRNYAWDDYAARLIRYEVNEYYYNNLQYDLANRFRTQLRKSGALYTHTRSIYNPVYRVVNIYADKIYPGTINFETLDTGAITIAADDAQRAAITQLFRWSNWNAEKQLYVRQGEKLGDVFLKVVDDIESRRVVLEVLDPQKVKYVRKDPAGNIEEIWIEYPDKDNDKPGIYNKPAPDTKTFTTTEVITQDKVEIYRDGELYDEWTNVVGFVPVVHVKSHDEGRTFGNTRWSIAKSKIDETNSQAALLNDQVRKAIIPYWKVKGGELESDAVERNADNIDEILTISLDDGMDIEPLVSDIEITGVLTNIQAQLGDIERDLPELFLYKLYDQSVIMSGVALKQMFDLSVAKIDTAMGLYDDALTRACQMAMTIGGVNQYANFEPFNLGSFDAGNLDFTIRPRSVFYEGIDLEKKITLLQQSGTPPEATWELLLIKPEDQLRWRGILDKQKEQEALLAGRANSDEDPAENQNEETEREATIERSNE